MTLQVAPNLTLPPNFGTDTTVVIGTRRSGKSYWASRAVEVVHENGGQFVVVDPVGIWWGLRVAADGKGKGLPIAVFGGEHGDVPLEATGGELVARLVVERQMSVVLDLSDMTDGEQKRFVTDFARALFHLKKRNKSPILVVFEECHEFLPNRVDHGDATMVGAVKRLGKIGGNYGIGWMLISQRPAEVNTGAVNLSNNIIVGKLKGPHDRKRVDDWVSYNDADGSMLDLVPKLERGNLIAWIDERKPVVVRASAKRTLDTGRTPEAGDVRSTLKALPPIDLTELREAMAATIEEAKANDPKALRAKIAELERDLRKKVPTAAPAPAAKTRELIVYRVPDRQPELLAEIGRAMGVIEMEVGSLGREISASKKALASLTKMTGTVNEALAKAEGAQRVDLIQRTPLRIERDGPVTATGPLKARITNESSELPAGVGDLLAVLANNPSHPMKPNDVALFAGVKSRGGAWGLKTRALKEGGYVLVDGGRWKITQRGIDASPAGVEVPSGGADLLDFWQRRLPGPAGEMLGTVVSAPGISEAALADRLGRKPAGGAWGLLKRELTSRALIERRGGGWHPSELFG